MFDNSYLFMTKSFRIKGTPTVLHHRTCPCCNSKLVNIYYSARHETYLCKTCLDKENEKGAENDGH